MLFEFSFYSSLLLIFFVHGLVYAILLWRKSRINETPSDQWLSIFLILSVLYIAPWMLGFAGWYDTQPYRDFLFYFTFQHVLFIGPVIFFYVQSLLNPSFIFSKKEMWHLLPGMLYVLFTLVVWVTDKLILHRYYFLADGADREFDTWYQLAGYISMIIYFIACIRYYQLYRKLLVQVVSYADTMLFKWVRNFLVAFLCFLVVRLVFFILSFLFHMHYWDTWWYYLMFSLLFYYIAVTGYSNSLQTKVYFKTNVFTTKPVLLLQDAQHAADTVEEAEVISIETAAPELQDDALIQEWKAKILQLVVEQKKYEAPELTLTDLARNLGTNASVLSRAINKGFGMNFNDFINYYRVQAVIEKLKSGEHQLHTLLSIAFDCGFNSKATFNRAFKKAAGLNPKEWMDQNLQSQ